ncbi:nitroreductase family protein [Heliorestis acidaminivorans]|uniref:Nitroreductase family protein n=1 Tax=Heliorestis acidaminivorans TaxID=553427 RepID=A0A6I0F0V6_9FIRM|nr:nitroreductase family protein [Heliorestis acidaminivorans]KAB2952954.1 nitroreductase family protein [Heliorestis acidaminivorans]
MKSIFTRRSIRSYTDQPVDDATVQELLKAAMAAPSAGNQQPWHFIVVRDRQLLDQVPKIHPYAKMLIEAPVAILVCGDETLEKHKGYWVQDCSAATQNTLLAAEELGLGAVWLGIYPTEDRVLAFRKLFGLPEHVTPLSMIAIGHGAEKKPPADRFNPERVRYDRW